MSEGNILVATDSFVTIIDGERITVRKGKTRVREGHPLHQAAPTLFKAIDAQYDVETARQEPTPPPAPPAPPADSGSSKPADSGKKAAKKAAASPSSGE